MPTIYTTDGDSCFSRQDRLVVPRLPEGWHVISEAEYKEGLKASDLEALTESLR